MIFEKSYKGYSFFNVDKDLCVCMYNYVKKGLFVKLVKPFEETRTKVFLKNTNQGFYKVKRS